MLLWDFRAILVFSQVSPFWYESLARNLEKPRFYSIAHMNLLSGCKLGELLNLESEKLPYVLKHPVRVLSRQIGKSQFWRHAHFVKVMIFSLLGRALLISALRKIQLSTQSSGSSGEANSIEPSKNASGTIDNSALHSSLSANQEAASTKPKNLKSLSGNK